jgi:hypothetical protein
MLVPGRKRRVGESWMTEPSILLPVGDHAVEIMRPLPDGLTEADLVAAIEKNPPMTTQGISDWLPGYTIETISTESEGEDNRVIHEWLRITRNP